LQFVMPRGVPLYPVLITRFSLTTQQPTRRFMQLLLCAARSANCMKYWSQLGRRRASFVRSRDRIASRNELIEAVELSSLSWARWNSALRPVLGANKCSSFRSTNSSRVGGVSWFAAHRSLNLCHRTLTGASTLTRRKNGLLNSASTTVSSHISVVIQRSLHLRVTKSSSESISEKECCESTEFASAEGTCAFEADFSMAGVAAFRARRRRLKSCSSTRYDAIEDLPAHIPVACQQPLSTSWKVLASAQSYEHDVECRSDAL
jgi:hypothetical protein